MIQVRRKNVDVKVSLKAQKTLIFLRPQIEDRPLLAQWNL